MGDLPIYATDRIRVSAMWSEFFGETGIVVRTEPHTMVVLDGYREPLRFDRVSLELEPDA